MSIQLEASRFTSIAALAKEVSELLKEPSVAVLVLADRSSLDLVCEELERLLDPEDFFRVMFGDHLKVVELQRRFSES